MEGAVQAPSIAFTRPAHFGALGRIVGMRWPVFMAATALLAACGGGDATVSSETAAVSSSVATVPATVESTMPLEPPTFPTESTDTPGPSSPVSTGATSAAGSEGEGVPITLLEPVLLDAAARSGVDVGEVTVVSAELRDWPDGSLGCPVAGMLYTQVITPGYRVVIEAGGGQLDYRMNRRGAFRLCETGAGIPDVRPPSTMLPGTSLPGTSSPDT
jgi:hypothetical protein